MEGQIQSQCSKSNTTVVLSQTMTATGSVCKNGHRMAAKIRDSGRTVDKGIGIYTISLNLNCYIDKIRITGDFSKVMMYFVDNFIDTTIENNEFTLFGIENFPAFALKYVRLELDIHAVDGATFTVDIIGRETSELEMKEFYEGSSFKYWIGLINEYGNKSYVQITDGFAMFPTDNQYIHPECPCPGLLKKSISPDVILVNV